MPRANRPTRRPLVAVLNAHLLVGGLTLLCGPTPAEAASINCSPPASGRWSITPALGPVRCEGIAITGPSQIGVDGGDFTMVMSSFDGPIFTGGGTLSALDSSVVGAEFFGGTVDFIRSSCGPGRLDALHASRLTIADSTLEELRIRTRSNLSLTGLAASPSMNLSIDYIGAGFLHISNTAVNTLAITVKGSDSNITISNSTFSEVNVDEAGTLTISNVDARDLGAGSPSLLTVDGGHIFRLILEPRSTTNMTINGFAVSPDTNAVLTDDSGQYRLDFRHANIEEWSLRPIQRAVVTVNNAGLHSFSCVQGQEVVTTYNGGGPVEIFVRGNGMNGCTTVVNGSRVSVVRAEALGSERISAENFRFAGVMNATLRSTVSSLRLELHDAVFADPATTETFQVTPFQDSGITLSNCQVLTSVRDNGTLETTNNQIFRPTWFGRSRGVITNSELPTSLNLVDESSVDFSNTTVGFLGQVGDSPGDHVTIRGTLGFIGQGPVPNFHPQSTLTRVHPARFGSCGGGRLATGATISARRGGMEVFSGTADANGFIEIPIDFTAVNQNDPVELFVTGPPPAQRSGPTRHR